MSYDRELTIAREAAVSAGCVQQEYQGRVGLVESKSDASPVTDVDRACESLIRDMLRKAFPADGFLGEETGSVEGSSGRRWIVDPLDGTRPYLRGIPTYSALVALEDGNEPVVGVMHFAALKSTYWAAGGGGAFCDGEPIRVSRIGSRARVFGSALGFVERADTLEGRRLLSLMAQWDYSYGFMDAYTYACIASGRIDACVNLLDKPWDCAAACCIVREAGGAYSDIAGDRSCHNGSSVFTNGLVHRDTIEYLTQF